MASTHVQCRCDPAAWLCPPMTLLTSGLSSESNTCEPQASCQVVCSKLLSLVGAVSVSLVTLPWGPVAALTGQQTHWPEWTPH